MRIETGIFQDWNANKGNLKAQFVLVLFRLAYLIRNNRALCVVFFLYLILYRFFVEWVLNIEIPWSLKVGRGFEVHHGHGLVINGETVIGNGCKVRHTTTIGNKKVSDSSYSKCPKIGNNVDIGAHVCILGDISIGDNVVIGAGSIVVKDVPPNCVVAGNPARVIREFGI